MFRLFDRKGYMVTEAVLLTQDLIGYISGQDVLFNYLAFSHGASTTNTDWHSAICKRYKGYPIINLTSRSLPNA